MPVIHAANARTFSVPGSTFTGLAAPSTGAAETAVWMLTIAPGSSGMPHRLTREEVFVATAGRATATIDGHAHDIAAGDALIVPADADFAIGNPADTPFQAIVAFPVGGQACLTGGQPFTPPWAA